MLKRSAMKILVLSILSLLISSACSYAAPTASVRVINVPGGGTITLTVKNVSDNQPAENGRLKWSSVTAGETGWKASDQYIEITKSGLPAGWGMQFYSDNKNSSADPQYTGSSDPAGLVSSVNTNIALPGAWKITDTPLTGVDLEDPVPRPEGGFTDYKWHHLRDKSTPDENSALVGNGTHNTISYSFGAGGFQVEIHIDNIEGVLSYDIYRASDMNGPWTIVGNQVRESGATTTWIDTSPPNTAFYKAYVAQASSFVDADEYITVWNQHGIAWGDNVRSGNPNKAYIYFATNFTKSRMNTEYETSMLTLEAFHDVSAAFPFYIYQDGAPAVQVAYEHIVDKMDKYFKGGQNRLVESYDDPFPSGISPGTAFTYDNALTICSLLARPTEDNLKRAKYLCQTLIWLQDNDPFADGRLRNAYDASGSFSGTVPLLTSGNTFTGSATGNIAWSIIAMAQYYKNSGDDDPAFMTRLVTAMEEAGNFIDTNFTAPNGFYYGFGIDGTTLDETQSTEHNIAAYVAFTHLHHIDSSNPVWANNATHAKNFITSTWDATEGSYHSGFGSGGSRDASLYVSDVNLLAALALGTDLSGNIDSILNYTVNTFTYNEGVANQITGIDFGFNSDRWRPQPNGSGSLEWVRDNNPDGVWFEGTAMLAQAYKVAGHYGYSDNSSTYLGSIKLAQYHNFYPTNSGISPDYKSIPASSVPDSEEHTNGLTTGLGWNYYTSPHIAATAWSTTASLDYNAFWGTSLSSDVPTLSNNISFTAPASSTEVDNAYLSNHYVPSGWWNGGGNMYTDPRYYDAASGTTSFKIHYTGGRGNDGWNWNTLVWQEPENEATGGIGKGYDLTGATKLKFKIKSNLAAHVIKVYLGYEADSSGVMPPNPSASIVNFVTVDRNWKDVTIDLLDGNWNPTPGVLDMSHVSNGFSVIIETEIPCDIYLDDIRFDNV